LFKQFKALEFKFKMDLQIKKKERKKEKKTVSQPDSFRPSLSPSTGGLVPSPTPRALSFSRVGLGILTLGTSYFKNIQ
jgi:hypothetical protein